MSKGTIIGLSVGVVVVIVIIFMFMGGGSWSDETKTLWKKQECAYASQECCDCLIAELGSSVDEDLALKYLKNTLEMSGEEMGVYLTALGEANLSCPKCVDDALDALEEYSY